MSSENSPPETPVNSRRRASFVPTSMIPDIFGRSPGAATSTPTAYPGPIAAAAASAQAQHRRRMSISTLGLAGTTGTSPTSTSPFATHGRSRHESSSSSTSGFTGGTGAHTADMNESAVEDGDHSSLGSTPTTPFTRRMSFGARAMGSVRGSLTGSNGEGFNWSDQLRNRAQRSSSAATPFTSAAASTLPPSAAPSAARPAPEPPKPAPRSSNVPDHFQERILKGDFYMD